MAHLECISGESDVDLIVDFFEGCRLASRFLNRRVPLTLSDLPEKCRPGKGSMSSLASKPAGVLGFLSINLAASLITGGSRATDLRSTPVSFSSKAVNLEQSWLPSG